ncbi:AAL030Cp [Eremothecium gossypii ATCC 10895]|uniref:AAL030Cp n=1 Tax=Eremothecium gossypii (strain ATCC 10895 / CBS 109.51 / FGSC 9923 / NRRL Y-1056) TaxID=284811 RepID=Q75EV8_EREGS|nr:AAL030Cp [Eremothecium gossypii ATCC 10895]AAS50336.2 AAL030Cp [Eremothecium gossypii ATCC 10895]AEY94622.1 FAAL030Cp [Eremothecium gossypii FDAG1]
MGNARCEKAFSLKDDGRLRKRMAAADMGKAVADVRQEGATAGAGRGQHTGRAAGAAQRAAHFAVAVGRGQVTAQQLPPGPGPAPERGGRRLRREAECEVPLAEFRVWCGAERPADAYTAEDVVVDYVRTERRERLLAARQQGLELRCTLAPLAEAQEALLEAISLKCFEYELRREQWAAKAAAARPEKRRRRRGQRAAVRLPAAYQDVEVCVCELQWNKSGDWCLVMQVSLWCLRNSVNHFSTDTNELLDMLYGSDQYHSSKLEVPRTYVQHQFLHQVARYTRQTLTGSGDLAHVPQLKVELLPFQQESVQWMLEKETVKKTYGRSDEELLSFLNEQISYGYHKLSGDWFWNKLSGYVITEADVLLLYQAYLRDEIHAKGMLSEEMGLGKTVEVLALLLLRPRAMDPVEEQVYEVVSTGKRMRRVKTNLIVCPQVIVQQWLDEIAKHVDGSLKAYHYRGFANIKEEFNTENISELVATLSEYDVIITSYATVSAEVHYAEYSTTMRSRRHKSPKYDYSSPLSLMQFFRIILDEVQMLGSESTNAARCTNLLQRIHTWGVSGTPIHSLADFKVVFSYLQLHPFQDSPKYIDTVCQNTRKLGNNRMHLDPAQIRKLQRVNGVTFTARELLDIIPRFNLCIRHTKNDVEYQIKIPKQHHYLIQLQFSPIERDNYVNLWKSFLEASGYDSDGQGPCYLGPAVLNYWLSQLRKTCCHAMMSVLGFSSNEAGNLSALGKGALKSSVNLPNMNDVLKYMIDDVQDKIDSLCVENYSLKIQSAQVRMELEELPSEAIRILKDVENQLITDFKTNLGISDPYATSVTGQAQRNNKAADEVGSKKKNKIRIYMDFLHQCTFFIATAYYFMGSKKLEKVDEDNEKLDQLGQAEAKQQYTDIYSAAELHEITEIQELEHSYYDIAEKLRKQILVASAGKVEDEIQLVRKYLNSKRVADKTQLRHIEFQQEDLSSNMTVASCYKTMADIFQRMNQGIAQFNGLLKELEEVCMKPINHEYDDNDAEAKAQDYENSINDQDKIFALLDCLERILSNRDEIITSDEEVRIPKVSSLVKDVTSDYHRELLKQVQFVGGTPLKQIFADLKNVSIVMGLTVDGEAKTESFESYLLSFQSQPQIIKKENHQMREILKRFNSIYNAKTAYFSNLQKISDSLVSIIQLEPSVRATILRNTRGDSMYLKNIQKISTLQSRLKYLQNLTKLEQALKDNKRFNCTICLCDICDGAIIGCGHFFCQECISSWLETKQSCPLCKTQTKSSELYSFKFREEETELKHVLVADADSRPTPSQEVISQAVQSIENDPIYLNKYEVCPYLDRIRQLETSVNYGSKIDFVIKLLKYLRLQHETNPTSPALQIVIYSQYAELLEIVAHVLKQNSIKFLTTTKNVRNFAKVVETFKADPEITCLLLDTKRQASGLTLINATHVFLLEPIVNNSTEFQAINRIHRIGQTSETYVWHFMLLNTVEHSILRYKSILEKNKGDSTKGTRQQGGGLRVVSDEDTLSDPESEAENAYNINQAGDEAVSEEHLWHCLFQK